MTYYQLPLCRWWMDGWVRVLHPFSSISVISRRWKGEHERLCAMKRRLGSGRISPPAGFEPATPWSEVGSTNRSATWTLHFADDIVVNAEEEEEADVLIDHLDTTATRYKMEIGPDKTNVMTNNPNGFQREIKIKGQRLEEVENFNYLGAIISNEGSKPEIFFSRIAQTAAVLSRLKIIWRDKNSSLASKVKLMWTLILTTFLYACESWTLTKTMWWTRRFATKFRMQLEYMMIS